MRINLPMNATERAEQAICQIENTKASRRRGERTGNVGNRPEDKADEEKVGQGHSFQGIEM